MGQAHYETQPGEQHLLANGALSQISKASQASQVSPDLFHLALRLIAELGACIQMIASDLLHAHEEAHEAQDLDLAAHRWAQHLRAVIALVEELGNGSARERERSVGIPTLRPLVAPYATATTQTEPGSSRLARPMRRARPTSALASPVRLTPREREVLRLAERGYPPRIIAKRLYLSVETVYTHRRNIRRKQQQHAQP